MNITLRFLPLQPWVGVLCIAVCAGHVYSGELRFQHHFISTNLPATSSGGGSYGLSALADINGDGDLDFVCGGRAVKPERLYWFEYRGKANWERHLVGTNYQSDVGLAAFDVDRDGWTDLVCSGVWFRNRGKDGKFKFDRHSLAHNAAGAHDIITADIDGDGTDDIVMMGDERTQLNSLCWFKIPSDPLQPWSRFRIGDPIHGAIVPNGVMDVDGDGDMDVLRGNAWFENLDGKGQRWAEHKNIPMGRKGPYGICVRTEIVDLDGDGKPEIVMADCDIVDSRVAILTNLDGKGGAWKKEELPRSFTYGSLHALAVADLDGDNRPDIIANEQEELLPEGRTNPRWIVWQNLGNLKFAERVILDSKLGGHELRVGDVDGDGDIDICSKPWHAANWNAVAGRIHVDYLENLLK